MGATNTASFLVRRTGPTNADLVVSYALSSSASNGVDYVKLPGSVTIPAGTSTALIVDRLAHSSGRVEDGIFEAVLPAPGSTPYQVEVSNDLLNWEPMRTNVPSQGAIQSVDPEAPNLIWRFYRVVPQTGSQ